jgi:NitT/TauT family transport system permease protein
MQTRKETVVTLVALAVLWQFSSLFFPEYLVPGFQILLPEFVTVLTTPVSYEHILASLLRIIVAFSFSVVAGVAIGIGMGVSDTAERYLIPALRVLMGIPALSLILVAVIWFRVMEVRVFFVIVAIALPIMVLNTLDGIKAIQKELSDMLLSFRPTVWQRVRILVLPGATPQIVTGMKVALSFATRLAVFAELIGTTRGFGSVLYAAFQTFNLTGVFVWTTLLVALLYALNAIVVLIEHRLLRWRPMVRSQ